MGTVVWHDGRSEGTLPSGRLFRQSDHTRAGVYKLRTCTTTSRGRQHDVRDEDEELLSFLLLLRLL